ncbi:MAG TPA: DUF1648 domain-containing protein [Candidatus Sulfotelmatobacter sp.]|nr:DUF1648 domain-containing protein [Candidatus Sulfotelmatobacter sp.]
MLIGIGIGAGLVMILASIVETAARYGSLPDRVPIHVGLNGVPDRYGPRAAIWTLVAVELGTAGLFLVVGWLLATQAAPGRGHGAGFPIFAFAVLALLWRTQRLVLEAARTGKADVRPFWLFFVVAFGVGTWAMVAL